MIEFVELKVLNSESYILNLRNEEERWLFIFIRNRSSFSIEKSFALNVLAHLTAKNASIRIIQQSTFESTSSSLVQSSISSASVSSASSIKKQSVKDSYSSVKLLNYLLEIDQISIDLITLSKSDRKIDSADFNVANIVEKKTCSKTVKEIHQFRHDHNQRKIVVLRQSIFRIKALKRYEKTFLFEEIWKDR
jgi:hypothetical protein